MLWNGIAKKDIVGIADTHMALPNLELVRHPKCKLNAFSERSVLSCKEGGRLFLPLPVSGYPVKWTQTITLETQHVWSSLAEDPVAALSVEDFKRHIHGKGSEVY